MKRLLIKIVVYISVIYLILYTICLIFNDTRPLNESLIGKVSDLNIPFNEDSLIIISGDSRAERQLNPLIFDRKTERNTFNIAISSGDFFQLIPYLNKFSKKTTFIISASLFQINDNDLNFGDMSLEFYQQLNLFERIWLYRYSPKTIVLKESQLLRTTIKSLYRKILNVKKTFHYDSRVVFYKGFLPIEGHLRSCNSLKQFEKNHGWYKDYDSGGIRKRKIADAIAIFSKTKHNFIIYQAPVAPLWYNFIKNKYIDSCEVDFSKFLFDESNKYQNIDFFDFYKENQLFHDSMFYDPQHLNKQGAFYFTNLFIEKLMKKKYCVN